MHYSTALTGILEVGVEVNFDDAVGDCLGKLPIVSLAYWERQWIRASCFELPEPPWKTRNTGFGSEVSIFSLTLGTISMFRAELLGTY